jgi:hypothetical protein
MFLLGCKSSINLYYAFSILLFAYIHVYLQYVYIYIHIHISKSIFFFSTVYPLFQPLPLLRGHKPAGQRGAQVHPQDRQHGLRRSLHGGDVPQVDRLRPLQILLQRVDLPGLCHRLCKDCLLSLRSERASV